MYSTTTAKKRSFFDNYTVHIRAARLLYPKYGRLLVDRT